MEISEAQENPTRAEYKELGMDIAGVGGGVVLSVAGFEYLNGELGNRGVPMWGLAVVDLIGAGLAFSASYGSKGFLKKILVGVGAGASVELFSTGLQALRGG